MSDSETKILVKTSQARCMKCYNLFQPQEEVVMIKNSSMLHKKCFDDLQKKLKEEDVRNI